MKNPPRNSPRSLLLYWRTNPKLGFLSAAFGTVIAVVLVPEDVRPAGALFWSSLAMTIGLLLVPLSVVWQSPVSAFYPVHVVVASPVYWLLLDELQFAYDLEGVTTDVVRTLYVAIGCFACFAWIAASARPWPLPKVVLQAALVKLSIRQLYLLSLAAFALAFLRFAIPAGFNISQMIGAFGNDRWAAPWARGALGGWNSFLDHFVYFGYLVPALTVLLGRRGGWTNWRTITSAVFGLILLALISQEGGRRVIGVMVGSAFVVWFVSAHPPRFRHLVVFFAAACVLLIFMQLMLIYRNVGIAQVFSVREERVSSMGPGYLHVDDNFRSLCEVINIIPEDHPHVGSRWLLWVAVRPVPRVLWPGKPLDPGFDLAKQLDRRGVALAITTIGEAYMAFGLIGVCVTGWIVGRAATTLGCVFALGIHPGALIIFGAGLMALFAGMRSAIELVLMGYAVLAWIALAWLYRTMSSQSRLPKTAQPTLRAKPK